MYRFSSALCTTILYHDLVTNIYIMSAPVNGAVFVQNPEKVLSRLATVKVGLFIAPSEAYSTPVSSAGRAT